MRTNSHLKFLTLENSNEDGCSLHMVVFTMSVLSIQIDRPEHTERGI